MIQQAHLLLHNPGSRCYASGQQLLAGLTHRGCPCTEEQQAVSCIVVQGDEDEVVPPNQAQIMFDALKDRGVTTALAMFAGEQHGFRQATNIRWVLCCFA